MCRYVHLRQFVAITVKFIRLCTSNAGLAHVRQSCHLILVLTLNSRSNTIHRLSRNKIRCASFWFHGILIEYMHCNASPCSRMLPTSCVSMLIFGIGIQYKRFQVLAHLRGSLCGMRDCRVSSIWSVDLHHQ